MFTSVDKALAAFIASLVYLLSQVGFDLSWLLDIQNWLVPAIAGILVWIVPNKA